MTRRLWIRCLNRRCETDFRVSAITLALLYWRWMCLTFLTDFTMAQSRLFAYQVDANWKLQVKSSFSAPGPFNIKTSSSLSTAEYLSMEIHQDERKIGNKNNSRFVFFTVFQDRIFRYHLCMYLWLRPFLELICGETNLKHLIQLGVGNFCHSLPKVKVLC